MKYPITATLLFLAFSFLGCSPEQQEEEEFHFYTFSVETERVIKKICSQENKEFTENLEQELELRALTSDCFPIEKDSMLRSHLRKLILNVDSLKKTEIDSSINQLMLIIDPSLEEWMLFQTYEQMFAIEKELNLICQTSEAYAQKIFYTEEMFLEFIFCELKDSLLLSKYEVNYKNDEACASYFKSFRKKIYDGSYSSLEEKRTDLILSFDKIFEIIKME